MIDFNQLYKDYYKRSFCFAKSYVYDDGVAEDIVSESLVSLWQVTRKEEVAHPLSLLLTILKNNSLNYLKAQERRLDAMDSMSDMLKRDLDYRINSLDACDPQDGAAGGGSDVAWSEGYDSSYPVGTQGNSCTGNPSLSGFPGKQDTGRNQGGNMDASHFVGEMLFDGNE